MEIVIKLYNSVKVKRIIKRNLKKNGFDRKQFENDLIEWQNRNQTIEAMKHIDGDYAEILMAASQFFPDGIVPKEQKERMKIIDSFDEETINQIYELDRCMSDHDSTQKLYDFIHNHRGDFLNF